MQKKSNSFLKENLEQGDLKRLVHPKIHVDQYKSKMGDDKDICVVSFKIKGKEPANDLVAFVEKGYDWVLDADVSTGELEDGDYLVFVELDRTKELAEQIYKLVEEIVNLTEQNVEEWKVRYHKDQADVPLTVEALQQMIPSTPEEYTAQVGDKSIDDLKTAAGIPVDTKAPDNEYTESLRIAAGIK